MRSLPIVVSLLVLAPWTIDGASALTFPPPTSLVFAGHTWIAQSGPGTPGPNLWRSDNAFVDADGALHLKITFSKGHWYAAEVHTVDAIGFGHYAFQVVGPLGALDPRVIFDLYDYGTTDYIDEIDTEFGRYGQASVPAGHYNVYPNEPGTPVAGVSFPVPKGLVSSTHTLDWSSTSVVFRSVDDATGATFGQWTFAPTESHRLIPQDPLPFHINLWLHQGKAPLNHRPVEIVVRAIAMP